MSLQGNHLGVLDIQERRRRVFGYRLGLRLPAARSCTHRRDDRFLQREARHLRRRRVVVSPSHHLHVARCEGNWSRDDAQLAKSGELAPEAPMRVDAIRETCLADLDRLWIISSPKLSIQSTN